jgi:hypothetical protein
MRRVFRLEVTEMATGAAREGDASALRKELMEPFTCRRM